MIQVWCAEFDRTDDGDTRRDPLPLRDITNKRRGDKRAKDEKVKWKQCGRHRSLTIMSQFLEGSMTLKPIVHEIRIQNQVIFLDPPIEDARSTWIRQLHDWLGTFTLSFENDMLNACFRCRLPATTDTKLAI
jgi:hypothetical protein